MNYIHYRSRKQNMKVASYNGCKVYNLSSGKTMPQWMSQTKKKALQKDEEYRRRLELIQDFEMPTASQCIAMTKDAEHIIVTGTYPPIVKCYTTSDMSLKFQRGLTCEVVAMQTLSEDYQKLVFLQSDRTLNFHAAYGTHYSIRVPKFGRDLLYNYDNCDLYVGGTGNEIYRLNLESGQFREPFQLSFEGCNKMHLNPVHQLLACGGEQGIVDFWDGRSRKKVTSLIIKDHGISTNDVTALKFDTDGLTFGLGTASGFCHIYDIRSQTPVHTKEHQYGLPIVDITYHNESRTILTTDKKLVKIWERDGDNMGKIVTNIETPADISNLTVAHDRRGMSGLLMMAGEQSRVMTYFVPQLGPAPRWCSFLENLTEELEETASSTVYEDYKFVTKKEIEELGATGLIGTPMLKGYMHGFFMEMKLYNKLRAASKPFEFEEYRKQKIKEKIEEKRQSRISTVKRLPKVNKELAEKMMRKAGNDKKKQGDEEVTDAKQLIDPRFAALFEREEFQQNQNDQEFKLRHPTMAKKYRAGESDDELDLYEEIEDDDGIDNRKSGGNDYEMEESEDDHESEHDDSIENYLDDDEEEEELRRRRKQKVRKGVRLTKAEEKEEELGAIARASMKAKIKQSQMQNLGNKKMKMFSLADGVSAADVVFAHTDEMKKKHKLEKRMGEMAIEDRLRLEKRVEKQLQNAKVNNTNIARKDNSARIRSFKNKEEGIVREISFVPRR